MADQESFQPDRAERQAKAIVAELEKLLNNIYAEFNVSRDQANQLVTQGRELADQDGWPGGPSEIAEFMNVLGRLEQKINQALDLRKLKEEGLIKAVHL